MVYAEVSFNTVNASRAIGTRGPHGQTFSYAVATRLELQVGDAVLAPFGSRLLPGIVVGICDEPAFTGELRTIEQRLGDASLLPAHVVALARWLSDYYVAPLAACISLLLPRGSHEPGDFLPPVQSALRLDGSFLDAARALQPLPPALAGRALRSLVALVDQGGPLLVALLRQRQGLTSAVQQALLAGGMVTLIDVAAVDQPTLKLPGVARPRLTADQQVAADAIVAAMRARLDGHAAPGSFVLHGVTGSGKTEVYLAALDAAVAVGRQGIVLVPEIALTPQTLQRFSARFPGRVALMHGQVARGKHRAQWFGARAGAYDVVVGARSALFAPLQAPALIVLDEEHEPSYKQSDPAPRYHAREAAAELARQTGAVLVLGSATPDLGSYRRAMDGDTVLLRLDHRVVASRYGAPGTATAALLTIVDMAEELRQGNTGVLSRSLDAELDRTLALGEQGLLFLNRRGAASLLLCRDCGHAPRCPRCSVTYALHSVEARLVCHQCHHSRGIPVTCPACRSRRIRPVGLGTQRLEELVQERFPGARVLRWDRDTAGTPARHAAFAKTVAAGEVDIVIGTQMIAKGHDFPGIALVGVVSADLSLNVPDFRAAERTFQLLLQVAGRAGRRERQGQVFIQTYAPDHYAVRAAAAADYAAFYEQESAFRRQFAYPPFTQLTRLVYAHSKAATAESEAKRYAEHLAAERERLGLPGPRIVGPAPCYLSRLNGRYRWQLLLKGPPAGELLRAAPPPQRWSVDVDPVDVL
ncbi:MAG: replication restart helicase PriA [Dehalococcoidia bacterium]